MLDYRKHISPPLINIISFPKLRLHGEIIDYNVQLTPDMELNLPPIFENEVEIKQVLLNLILNACDVMLNVAPQQRRLVIVTSSDDSKNIMVTVRDTGTGINETELECIFDQFYTTKHEGLGMGLSISQRIMPAHGGRIWASNNSDGGAMFSFTLPISYAEGCRVNTEQFFCC